MRKIIISLVVALASLVPAGVSAQTAPENKATASDLQGDAPSEYTVVKGDTLWGIAAKFLKEPFKWPLIWQMNREQIKNPHLIYPGDIIRLDRSGAYPELSLLPGGVTQAAAVGNVVRLEPRTRVLPLSQAVPSIPGAAIGPFLSQPMVIEEGGLDNAPEIVATEERRVVVGAGNTAYADRMKTTDGVSWQVFRPGQPLRDPESGEVLGYEAKYVGDARVKRFGTPSTLEITKARQEINMGDRLVPARETSFPSYIPRPPDKPIKGAIMSVDGGVSELGQYQIVTLNRGSRDGVEVGHVLASYRRGETVKPGSRTMESWAPELLGGLATWWSDTVGYFGGEKSEPAPATATSPVEADTSVLTFPDERNGLVFVFRVFEKMSYAMVMRSTSPIYIGDVVQTP